MGTSESADEEQPNTDTIEERAVNESTEPKAGTSGETSVAEKHEVVANKLAKEVTRLKKHIRKKGREISRKNEKQLKEKHVLQKKIEAQRKMITRLRDEEEKILSSQLSPTSLHKRSIKESDLPEALKKQTVSFF